MSSEKFGEVKTYLTALPETLLLPSGGTKINRLLNFSLDETWVSNAGVDLEQALNWEIALGKFLPRNDGGVFFMKERGEVVEALADILEMYPWYLLKGSYTMFKLMS